MKDISYPNWINSIPENGTLLSQNQQDARRYLKENGLPKKSFEEWRLTNLSQVKELLELPLNSIDQELNLYKSINNNEKSFQIIFQ